jgi:simple sugar transport system ATP-binding protein
LRKKLLRCRGISVKFGAVKALDNVDFDVNYNEIVGLVGDNGAGKSTLIKVISGIYHFYEGNIFYEDKKVKMTPIKAIELGIATVHQHKTLCDLLDIGRNLFIGKEPTKKIGFLKILDLQKMKKESMEVLDKIGLSSIKSPDIPVGNLSGGEQQAITITRSVYLIPHIRLLILDEPVRNLSIKESEKVIKLIKGFPLKGISVVFITHDVGQAYEIADRLVIISRGKKIGDLDKKETTIERMRELVRGRE